MGDSFTYMFDTYGVGGFGGGGGPYVYSNKVINIGSVSGRSDGPHTIICIAGGGGGGKEGGPGGYVIPMLAALTESQPLGIRSGGGTCEGLTSPSDNTEPNGFVEVELVKSTLSNAQKTSLKNLICLHYKLYTIYISLKENIKTILLQRKSYDYDLKNLCSTYLDSIKDIINVKPILDVFNKLYSFPMKVDGSYQKEIVEGIKKYINPQITRDLAVLLPPTDTDDESGIEDEVNESNTPVAKLVYDDYAIDFKYFKINIYSLLQIILFILLVSKCSNTSTLSSLPTDYTNTFNCSTMGTSLTCATLPDNSEPFVGYEKLPPRTKPEPPRKMQRKEPIQNDFTMQYILHPRYS